MTMLCSGRTLGGSSSINGGHWTRGLAAQYDAWSNLLETSEASVGWNWQNLWGYMKKVRYSLYVVFLDVLILLQAETFSAPNAGQKAKGADSIASYHGTAGPVQVTYPDLMFGGPEQPAFVNSIVNLTGIAHYKDLNGGTSNCVSITPVIMDWHRSDHRSSSIEAYLTPVESARTNWVTLTGQMVSQTYACFRCSEIHDIIQVTQITWSSTNIPIVASGVEFGPSSGGSTRYTAKARREVILAAGAIQTPALLQLSGVGDSSALGSLGVTTHVNLKTVGRNLQEQVSSVCFRLFSFN